MARKRSAHAVLVAVILVAGLGLSLWNGLIGAQESDAQVRVVHAGYGIGPVDIYIDDDLAIEALEYSDATEYLALPAGEYDFQVTAAGGDAAEALIDTVLVLDGGTPHTVVAIGPADQADVIVIIDDHTPPSAEMAKLSLVNATSDGMDVGLALSDGTVLVEDVPFADASEYLEREAGTYDFVVLAVDTGEEVASISGFSAEPGAIYSLFVIGVDGEYQAVAFVDALGAGPGPNVTPADTASTPTPSASTSTTTSGAPTVTATTVTPVATPASTTTQPSATPAVVMPTLPDTGDGGASGSGGLGGWLVIIAGAAALVGVATWRFSHVLSRGRS